MKSIIVLALLTGCATTPKKLVEMDRTEFYRGCLDMGAPITFCECAEGGLTEKFPEQLLRDWRRGEAVPDDGDQKKIEATQTECIEVAKKTIEKDAQ